MCKFTAMLLILCYDRPFVGPVNVYAKYQPVNDYTSCLVIKEGISLEDGCRAACIDMLK